MRLVVAAIVLSALLAACGSSRPSETPHTSTTAKTEPPSRVTTSALDTEAHPLAKPNYVAPIATIQLVPSLAKYTEYVDGLVKRLPAQVDALQAATARGDLPAAESAWRTAHSTYLDIGQDDAAYGAFGDLGQQIDGLADGLPHTTQNPQFTGFHKVEFDLWKRHDASAAAADSTRLAAMVHKLTPAQVQSDLPINPTALDAWVLRCHEILEDGLRDSLSQADNYGSNTDLASLAADVKATDEMLSVLAPLIKARAPEIVPKATVQLRTLDQAIAAAGGATDARNLRLLPVRRRQALNEAAGAALETLAPVSEIIQVSVPGS
jgi:high-affinity iron transporter